MAESVDITDVSGIDEADSFPSYSPSPSIAAAAASHSPDQSSEYGEENINSPPQADMSKQRSASSGVGVSFVPQRASNLNSQFFRRNMRRSHRARLREQRRRLRRQNERAEEPLTANDAVPAPTPNQISIQSSEHSNPPAPRARRSRLTLNSNIAMSLSERLHAFVTFRQPGQRASGMIVTATLVEEDQVFEAERIKPNDTKDAKSFRILVISLLICGIIGSILGTTLHDRKKTYEVPLTNSPSLAPTFDSRPTLEIVRERGKVLCGSAYDDSEEGVKKQIGFHRDICRAVSAVIFDGDTSRYAEIVVTNFRWAEQLASMEVDLSLAAVTHTLEREVMEPRTGFGFDFSVPYYYDGMRYIGIEKFVTCAEEFKRFGECKSLMICTVEATTHYDYISSNFPSTVHTTAPSLDALKDMLVNGACNVIATEHLQIFNSDIEQGVENGTYILGSKAFTKEPLAAVTRKNDREWSDIVNWVVRALIHGETKGLKRDMSLCSEGNINLVSFSLAFDKAVYCMGNYGQIFYRNFDRRNRAPINTINNGTPMIYAIPHGNIDSRETFDLDSGDESSNDITRLNINENDVLRCGVVSIEDIQGDLTGLSVDYCHALAAALFNGDSEALTFQFFAEGDYNAIDALLNGTIDVLAGSQVNLETDVWLQFSTPYFYQNAENGDEVKVFALATRDDDKLFSSFVHSIMLATLYAQESGITHESNRGMPLMSVFGTQYLWAMRDAIAHSGSYDEMYYKHFGTSPLQRGRNELNINATPQLLSPPMNFG